MKKYIYFLMLLLMIIPFCVNSAVHSLYHVNPINYRVKAFKHSVAGVDYFYVVYFNNNTWFSKYDMDYNLVDLKRYVISGYTSYHYDCVRKNGTSGIGFICSQKVYYPYAYYENYVFVDENLTFTQIDSENVNLYHASVTDTAYVFWIKSGEVDGRYMINNDYKSGNGDGVVNIPTYLEGISDAQAVVCGGAIHFLVNKDNSVFDIIYDYSMNYKASYSFTITGYNETYGVFTASCKDLNRLVFTSVYNEKKYPNPLLPDNVVVFEEWIVNNYTLTNAYTYIYNHSSLWDVSKYGNITNLYYYYDDSGEYLFVTNNTGSLFLIDDFEITPPTTTTTIPTTTTTIYGVYGSLTISNIVGPRNTNIGNNMTTKFTIRNTKTSGEYYYVECDYISPTGRHYYPKFGCGYISGGATINGSVSKVADEIGLWRVVSCSVYTSNSACSVFSLSQEVDFDHYFVVGEAPSVGYSENPRKCKDKINEWFVKKYDKPLGGSFVVNYENRPTSRSGRCYDECISRGYSYGACSVIPSGEAIGSFGVYGCYIVERCYCKDFVNPDNVDGLFIDGSYYTAVSGDWITDGDAGNVLNAVSQCYDVSGYKPSNRNVWFKDIYSSNKRALFVFSNNDKYIVVYQDDDDLLVWNNVTLSTAECSGGVSCYEFLSNKGMVYYFSLGSNGEGVFVIPYSDVIYGKRWARINYHSIIPSSNLFWGFEGMSDKFVLGSSGVYFAIEDYPTRFMLERYGDTIYFDIYNVSSYGFCRDIKSSGRYVFDDDLYSVVPRPYCLNITADNVDIDMRGYSLKQLWGGGSSGILVQPPSPFVWTDLYCNGCLSGIKIHDGSIEGFSYSGISVGGVKNSKFYNLDFKNNELAYRQLYADNVSLRNFKLSDNQNGLMIHATTDSDISDITGVSVIKDFDINYLNRSSLTNVKLGGRYITSVEKRSYSMSNNGIVCKDCMNSNFCGLDILSSKNDFLLTGSSKNNFFVSPIFRDSDVEIYGNKSKAKVGIVLDNRTSNNYICGEYVGRVDDYGSNNVIVGKCPENILSCSSRVCSKGWFCIDNITKAYVDEKCIISSITSCDYMCSGGNCVSKPLSEWGLELLPLLFNNPNSKFMFMIFLCALTGIGLKVLTKSTLVAIIVSLLVVVFGMIIGFIPVWIGIVILVIMTSIIIYEFKKEGGEF